ncbi:MAG TPA: nicotinate phosphoribosyltransferase [Bacteroidales bacterium]|nr:nicotinate phosphoribosyltransferase [Bacteroidales bacterium]
MEALTISGNYTDFYELTMGQAYFMSGNKDTQACFDYFFRKMPFGGGYVVFAGLRDVLDILTDFRFTDEDIRFLEDQGLSKDFLGYLGNFRFRGAIYASREGDIIFPTRPVIRVEGNIIETQIVETLILNILNYESLVATKASRMRQVAGGSILSEFGLRRAQGFGGIQASRAAIIGGFNSTSNVKGALLNGIKASGTMAHSYIQSHDDELTAFRNYANAHPDNSILLVDTYDTLGSGIPNAIKVARELEDKGRKLVAIRLDSGDLAYLAKKSRKMLDEAGLYDVKIVASNQLDEYLIKSLKEQKAPIDIFGVGTSLVTGDPDAALDGVYKLSLSGGEPRLKISENVSKITLPGRKQVSRLITAEDTFYGGDVVTLDENDDPDVMHHPFDPLKSLHISHLKKEPLLTKVMEKGKKISEDETPSEIYNYSKQRLTLLPDEFKRFDNPHVYKIGISENLKQLKSTLMEKYRSKE